MPCSVILAKADTCAKLTTHREPQKRSNDAQIYTVKPIRCVQFYGQVSMLLKVLNQLSRFIMLLVDIKTNSRPRNKNVSDFKSRNLAHMFEKKKC